jgi:hypothetical protein
MRNGYDGGQWDLLITTHPGRGKPERGTNSPFRRVGTKGLFYIDIYQELINEKE